jgi:soluble P-type ATPase
MISINVSGYRDLSLRHVVLDYNGTLARDGRLLDGVSASLSKVGECLELHVVTADTFGLVRSGMKGIRCRLSVLTQESQAEAKRQYVRNLGSSQTVAIGNGRNDQLMIKETALGIAVLGKEGTAVETILAADIVCASVLEALELLLNPKRLIATLRS